MSDNNCLQIDDGEFGKYVFNVSFDKIPKNVLCISQEIPYALSKRKGKLAINPLSGNLLAWKFDDPERGLQTAWDRWEIFESIPVCIEGPDGSYTWDIHFVSKSPENCTIKYFVDYNNSYIPCGHGEEEDSEENCSWEQAIQKLQILKAKNLEILVPEKTWRS